jgi:hypothetical protein
MTRHFSTCNRVNALRKSTKDPERQQCITSLPLCVRNNRYPATSWFLARKLSKLNTAFYCIKLSKLIEPLRQQLSSCLPQYSFFITSIEWWQIWYFIEMPSKIIFNIFSGRKKNPNRINPVPQCWTIDKISVWSFQLFTTRNQKNKFPPPPSNRHF